jgi:alpha-tubulin suppressor-like RCC1 family protein
MKTLLCLIIYLLSLTALLSQCFVQLSGGNVHSIGIKSDGTAWAWGNNFVGQLGNGTTVNSNSPVQMGNESNWTQISVGNSHNIALKNDGTLWAWGANNYGQLGDGTTINKLVPTKIGTDSDWKFIAASLLGCNLAIKTNGTLWAWGLNQYGQLGDGTTINRHTPTQIGTDSDWVTVATGYYHCMSIKSNGTLWAWGLNGGAFGDGTITNQYLPTKIGTETNWKIVKAGFGNTLAIKTDGTLWAWGDNSGGKLGVITSISSIPNKVNNDTNWANLSLGNDHSAALKTDGTLWTWGYDGLGAVGHSITANITTPKELVSLVKWQHLAAGGRHTMAIKEDGSLWVWGINESGQLGDFTNTTRYIPYNPYSCKQVGIDEISREKNQLLVYPNPTTDFLYFEEQLKHDFTTYSITDIAGRVIQEGKISSNSIQVSQVARGIYILSLKGKSASVSGKFIKE